MIIQTQIMPFEVAFTRKDEGSQTKETLMRWIEHHLPEKKMAFATLVHGTDIQKVKDSRTHTFYTADAVMTNNLNSVLTMRVGDCLSIAVMDKQNKAYMLVHGGWKNLLDGIMEKSLDQFIKQYASNPSDIQIWIGPSIQKCCNVWKEISSYDAYPDWRAYMEQEDDGYHVDMQQYIQDVCMSRGIDKNNIVNEGNCTYHEDEAYFSHRRATQIGKRTEDGRMGVMVWIQ